MFERITDVSIHIKGISRSAGGLEAGNAPREVRQRLKY